MSFTCLCCCRFKGESQIRFTFRLSFGRELGSVVHHVLKKSQSLHSEFDRSRRDRDVERLERIERGRLPRPDAPMEELVFDFGDLLLVLHPLRDSVRAVLEQDFQRLPAGSTRLGIGHGVLRAGHLDR